MQTVPLPAIHEGMRAFADAYTGHLPTETILTEGGNDGAEHLETQDRLVEREYGGHRFYLRRLKLAGG